jgi:hypothetical protein
MWKGRSIDIGLTWKLTRARVGGGNQGSAHPSIGVLSGMPFLRASSGAPFLGAPPEKVIICVKWAPNLATFAAAFSSHARQGSNSESQVVESLAVGFPALALAIVSGYDLSPTVVPHKVTSYQLERPISRALRVGVA